MSSHSRKGRAGELFSCRKFATGHRCGMREYVRKGNTRIVWGGGNEGRSKTEC